MRIKMSVLLSLIVCLASMSSVHAGWVLKDGWFVDSEDIATFSAEKHYEIACSAMEHRHWKEAAKHFRIVSLNFPTTAFGQDAPYYLGICYFNYKEYDAANEAFSKYLRCHSNPEFFEEAITYKFEIANRFKDGAKRRFFGVRKLPKWASGHELALEIYDEVIAAVPCHDLAAWSLYAKGDLFRRDMAYRESVEVYQQLIKRFPKHELAPESYFAISYVYLEQSRYELQNPDLLALAQINFRRFQQDFPRDERLTETEANVCRLKESYAKALYDIGRLYERRKYPDAAVLYYRRAIVQFPDTRVAQLCECRLSELDSPWTDHRHPKENDLPPIPPELLFERYDAIFPTG